MIKVNKLPQVYRVVILVAGSALIMALGWFGLSAEVKGLGKVAKQSHARSLGQLSAANDVLYNTERMVYENELGDVKEVMQFFQGSLTGNLQLMGFDKKAPVKLSGSDFGYGVSELYGYDLRMDLRGDYFSFLDYLEALGAQQKYKFYWVSIAYNVTKYPNADIKMLVRVINHGEGK